MIFPGGVTLAELGSDHFLLSAHLDITAVALAITVIRWLENPDHQDPPVPKELTPRVSGRLLLPKIHSKVGAVLGYATISPRLLERTDDIVGQNRWSLSEHMASNELVRGLLDDQGQVGGVPQIRSTDDETMILHDDSEGVFGSRANRIGQLSGSGHDKRHPRNLADKCGLC